MVEPLGLVLKAGIWYLIARREGEVRTYRVSRVRSVELLEGRFDRPKGFNLDAYWLVDLSAGFARNNWAIDLFLNNATDERAQQYRFAQCAEAVCGQEKYLYTAQPRTVGIRYSQKF